jgi:hypothetical protein
MVISKTYTLSTYNDIHLVGPTLGINSNNKQKSMHCHYPTLTIFRFWVWDTGSQIGCAIDAKGISMLVLLLLSARGGGGVTLYVGITPCAFQFLQFRGWFLAYLKKRVHVGTNRPPETSTLPQWAPSIYFSEVYFLPAQPQYPDRVVHLSRIQHRLIAVLSYP